MRVLLVTVAKHAYGIVTTPSAPLRRVRVVLSLSGASTPRTFSVRHRTSRRGLGGFRRLRGLGGSLFPLELCLVRVLLGGALRLDLLPESSSAASAGSTRGRARRTSGALPARSRACTASPCCTRPRAPRSPAREPGQERGAEAERGAATAEAERHGSRGGRLGVAARGGACGARAAGAAAAVEARAARAAVGMCVRRAGIGRGGACRGWRSQGSKIGSYLYPS